MDKVGNGGSQWNKWVKDIQQISKNMKQMKWRGQKQHLKQGDEQTLVFYNNKTYNDT